MHWVELVTNELPNARILDYGCGRGELVFAARDRGYDVFGTEAFYGGSRIKNELEASGALGNVIRELRDGRIDFEDESFDLVVNNMVFEHVVDLDAVLGEINRVMKKGAMLLSLFPSKSVLRETHIGIPLAHRLPKQSRFRYYYTLCLRSLGIGSYRANRSRSEWTRYMLNWIDSYTKYRTRKEILRSFSAYFKTEWIEDDYVRFRLSSRPHGYWAVGLLRIPLAPQLARVAFRLLGGLVITARKDAETSEAVY